ncbi:MAG: alpha/beta hydrolase [Phycisphaerales bacterium]|nr:alpha/beta hydrolase [Planctomycetota bacterium]MCH8508594.1 alpha/beta hydrolase [Phycisphaerales bacterium]
MLSLILAMLLAPAAHASDIAPPAPSHPTAVFIQEPDESAAPEPDEAGPGVIVQRGIRYIHREGVPARRTSLDVHRPAVIDRDQLMPILLYIHGGGWSIGDKAMVGHKPSWAARHGWVFVSVNYRLSPDVMHPEHARDVAAAVAWVKANARSFNGDPERIALMGHSAGAHLAAIVASDESLLAEHDLTPADLAGVVLLDGAGYNLPRRMKTVPPGRLGTMYAQAFGTDPELWERASPTLQARPGDTLPPLFCVHAGRRVEARVEGREIVAAWHAAGADAALHHAPTKDHMTINRALGTEGDPDTAAIAAFLTRAFRTTLPSETTPQTIPTP